MIIEEEDYLAHYGMPRRSGRYPWGSGDNPYQRASNFIGETARLRKEGLTEKQIAEYYGMTTTELRARSADMKSYKRSEDIAMARRLREKGMSTSAISERMDIPETTIRSLLKPDADAKQMKIDGTRDILQEAVDANTYIDIGKGVDTNLGVTSTTMNTAVQQLKDKGYSVYEVYIPQIGSGSHQTTPSKVLVPPGVTKADLMKNFDKIRVPGVIVDLDGKIEGRIKPPVSVDKKRIAIRYAEDGGTQMDGVIELRRGVRDLDLGAAHYAQVRIAVNDSHYLKGMAIYADDLPRGVDIRFNTNKKRGTPMLGDSKNSVLKELKDTGDPTNRFGAYISKQTMYVDASGKKRLSPLNILNEEGDWDKWSRSLSSQMLSKQLSSEIRRQLKKTSDKAQGTYDKIMSLTNPTVRRKLLVSFADKCDSDASDLKAVGYPRQASQVILPITGMKPTEIYAPNFKHGERVVLIRYPHGGTFEIPELVVNNRNKSAIRIMGRKALDAVGIHPSVAERLSGADFDGDNVVVIPNNNRRVRTSPPLEGLKGFDPKAKYPYREGMKVMKKGAQTQRQMGEISNLITDMTLKGATSAELARAVRHSMVVIDAAKHRLNYKQSEIDNGIADLRDKYQRAGRTDGKGGASTLISRAGSAERIPEVRLRKASQGGAIDPKTGKKVYIPTGRTYVDHKTGKIVKSLSKFNKMDLVDDANALSFGTTPERIYAQYANQMKSLANKARKASLAVVDTPYSPTARKQYDMEVKSLKAKLKMAYRNKPVERQAQVLANSRVKLQMDAHPGMDKDEIKKLKNHAISQARASLGSQKYKIDITPKEWKAIQSGAVRKSMLEELMDNMDSDVVMELALPRTKKALSSAQVDRARAMLKTKTTAEVAEALGVSATTIRTLVKEGA